MYQKMKLTDLRHLETSKEEMGFIKGGDDDPEKGFPICMGGCSCTTACTVELSNKEEQSEIVTNSRINSSTMNKLWGVITSGVSFLL